MYYDEHRVRWRSCPEPRKATYTRGTGDEDLSRSDNRHISSFRWEFDEGDRTGWRNSSFALPFKAHPATYRDVTMTKKTTMMESAATVETPEENLIDGGRMLSGSQMWRGWESFLVTQSETRDV